MSNLCKTCGRNYSDYPLVSCIREPYEDYHYTLTCRHFVTASVARMETRLAKIEMEKQLLAKRRAIRKEARRLRWAYYKQPNNLCRTCANNTAKFPIVQCKNQPFDGEEYYQEVCFRYHKITPGELMVFIKFPCGTLRELDWKPTDYKGPFGFTRCGNSRATRASLIGTAPLDKEGVFAAYKFLTYAMHPIDRKIFMNPAVKDVLKGYI